MAYTKNYYHILNLQAPDWGSHVSGVAEKELRRAYKIALLNAHPDKQHDVLKHDQREGTYSVDDVKEAYAILSDVSKRREYNEFALRNPGILGDKTTDGGQALSSDFILGLDVLDLSDFVMREDGEEMEWTRACRCGDEKGFQIKQEELEDTERRGEKEVLVGCKGCSLWLRVGFDVEED
ncbi:Diphthamide biosynthesis protein 4 [Coniothyrium glycines]